MGLGDPMSVNVEETLMSGLADEMAWNELTTVESASLNDIVSPVLFMEDVLVSSFVMDGKTWEFSSITSVVMVIVVVVAAAVVVVAAAAVVVVAAAAVVVVVAVVVTGSCVVAKGLYFSTNVLPVLPDSISVLMFSWISEIICKELVKLLLLALRIVIWSSRMYKSRSTSMLPFLQQKKFLCACQSWKTGKTW